MSDRRRAAADVAAVSLAAIAAPFALGGLLGGLLQRLGPAGLLASNGLLGGLLLGVAAARTRREERLVAAFKAAPRRRLLLDVPLGVAAGLGVLLLNGLLLAALAGPLGAANAAHLENLAPLKAIPLPIALVGALAAGVHEELVFRGYLLGRLEQLSGPAVAVVGQALVFAVGHGWQGGLGVAQSLVLGVLFGLAARRQGIPFVIAAHTTIDAVSFVLLHTLR